MNCKWLIKIKPIKVKPEHGKIKFNINYGIVNKTKIPLWWIETEACFYNGSSLEDDLSM